MKHTGMVVMIVAGGLFAIRGLRAEDVSADAAKEAVKQFESDSKTKDIDALIQSIDRLATFPHDDIIKPLSKYFDHEDDDVAMAAWQAVRKIEKAPSLAKEGLKAYLKIQGREKVLREAGKSLSGKVESDELRRLLPRVRDNEAAIPLVTMLGEIGDQEETKENAKERAAARTEMLKMYLSKQYDKRPSVLVEIITWLGKWKDNRIARQLTDDVRHENPYVAKAAITALGEMENGQSYKTILDSLMPGAGYSAPTGGGTPAASGGMRTQAVRGGGGGGGGGTTSGGGGGTSSGGGSSGPATTSSGGSSGSSGGGGSTSSGGGGGGGSTTTQSSYQSTGGATGQSSTTTNRTAGGVSTSTRSDSGQAGDTDQKAAEAANKAAHEAAVKQMMEEQKRAQAAADRAAEEETKRQQSAADSDTKRKFDEAARQQEEINRQVAEEQRRLDEARQKEQERLNRQAAAQGGATAAPQAAAPQAAPQAAAGGGSSGRAGRASSGASSGASGSGSSSIDNPGGDRVDIIKDAAYAALGKIAGRRFLDYGKAEDYYKENKDKRPLDY